jgi:hypothetical protein
MTSGNHGASTPKDDDPFGYLYADGQANGARPPSGAYRSSNTRTGTAGGRRPSRPRQPGQEPPMVLQGQAPQQGGEPPPVEETKVMPPQRPADHVPRHGGTLFRLRRSGRTKPRSGPAPRADHGAWVVDRVVRVLITACDRAERGLPAVHAITVGSDTVWLRLRTPDERPPEGWTAKDDGRVWYAPLRWLQSADVAESVQEPYRRLVSLGHTSDGFVLLNLSQAGGIIALEGDTRQARALAQEWTRELSTSPWSQGVRVVRVGFKPDGAETDGMIEAYASVNAERDLANEGCGVLLLARMPGGQDGERVRNLADDPDARWSVVVVGRVKAPRWRFVVGSTGVVDTGLLEEPVTPRTSSPADARARERTEAKPASHVLDGTPRWRRQRRPPFGRRWLIVALTATACLLAVALLHAPLTAEPRATKKETSQPELTKKQALARIAHYSMINNQANADDNRQLLDTVEDGPLYAISVAEYKENEGLPAADRKKYEPWSFDLSATQVYIPRFLPGQQRWFGALSYTRNNQYARILIMAEQPRTKRWEMVAVVAINEPQQIPKIAVDADGYATAVDATSARDVAVPVNVLRTGVLDNFTTGGDRTGKKVFASSKASRQQIEVHDENIHKFGSRGTTVFYTAPTEFPDSYALKTSDGGALVVFAHTHIQRDAAALSGEVMIPDKEDRAWLKDTPSPYFVYTFTCSDVATIPRVPGKSKLIDYDCRRTDAESLSTDTAAGR